MIASILPAGGLASPPVRRRRRKEEWYDLLYSLRWGDATTNNYGFAPAEADGPERFQLQLYAELLKLLEEAAESRIERVLEISCGRGGGFRYLALRLPAARQVIGLDVSGQALAFCRAHHADLPNVDFVRGRALQLPFPDGCFDLVINVEASHTYGDDIGFLREVRRVLGARGRLLFADHRTTRKLPRLERKVRRAGFAGQLRDVTPNVVLACELDSERRQALVRSGLPWWCRPLGVGRLQGYVGIPGTVAFERLRSRDRTYVIACLNVSPQERAGRAGPSADQAA